MISDSDYALCLQVLRALHDDPQAQQGAAGAQIIQAANALLLQGKRRRREAQAQEDRARMASTGIRQRRAAPALADPAPAPALADPAPAPALADPAPALADPAPPDPAPAAPLRAPACETRLHRGRRCYLCKQPYHRLHFFYDSLCAPCAEENYRNRCQSVDLSGRHALVTGARVKIGFEVALKLLRAGATVIGTTRFPADARRRFARQPDHEVWGHRLQLLGVDLRHLASVEALADHVERALPHLDILVNNAAQTVRRPAAYYRPLLAGEALPPDAPPTPGALSPRHARAALLPLSALLSQWPVTPEDRQPDPDAFPQGPLDRDGLPPDLRARNSWTLQLPQVSTAELVEVHAVNCIAPFILLRRLQTHLQRSPHPQRFVINVSAMEGVFSGRRKSPRHPHTNMAKAALNMLTHTCAGALAEHGIYLNSVDTGWVTNEFPAHLAQQMADKGFQPPLDEVDGAARICDPIFAGLRSGAPRFGQLLKDYRVCAW